MDTSLATLCPESWTVSYRAALRKPRLKGKTDHALICLTDFSGSNLIVDFLSDLVEFILTATCYSFKKGRVPYFIFRQKYVLTITYVILHLASQTFVNTVGRNMSVYRKEKLHSATIRYEFKGITLGYNWNTVSDLTTFSALKVITHN